MIRMNNNDGMNAGVAPAVQHNWAEAVIDSHRYNGSDRVMARYEDLAGRFPSCEDLEAKGGDLVALANGFQGGLTAAAFRQAIDKGVNLDTLSQAINDGLCCKAFAKAVAAGLNVEMFDQAVFNGLIVSDFAEMVDTMDIRELNGALANFVEATEEALDYPDPVLRAFSMLDEGAEVEFATC